LLRYFDIPEAQSAIILFDVAKRSDAAISNRGLIQRNELLMGTRFLHYFNPSVSESLNAEPGHVFAGSCIILLR
jgi:hypothetical protein